MEHELKASLSQKLSWWAAYLTCKTQFIPPAPHKTENAGPCLYSSTGSGYRRIRSSRSSLATQ